MNNDELKCLLYF